MTGGRATRGHLFVVGPSDTVLGLGLLGIEGIAAGDVPSAAAAFDRAMATPGVTLVLLGQSFAEPLRDRLARAAVDLDGPLVVEIPDVAEGGGDLPLSAQVERVLGIGLDR